MTTEEKSTLIMQKAEISSDIEIDRLIDFIFRLCLSENSPELCQAVHQKAFQEDH